MHVLLLMANRDVAPADLERAFFDVDARALPAAVGRSLATTLSGAAGADSATVVYVAVP